VRCKHMIVCVIGYYPSSYHTGFVFISLSAYKNKECNVKCKLSLKNYMVVFIRLLSLTYSAMISVYVAVLQECLELFPWLVNY
jgi:hypothetical protein